MIVTYRSLPIWPHPQTPSQERRARWTFKASYPETLDLLEDELRRIDGTAVVIGAGFQEGDIRRDGMPRADAREPAHPGVELSFTSRHGRLVYATDVCEVWKQLYAMSEREGGAT